MKEPPELEALAKAIAARVKGAKPASKQHLRLVTQEDNLAGMDAIKRESYVRMVRHYRRNWGAPMQLLIDQACFGHAGVEQLPDDALVRLMRDLERGLECIRDDVSFEDAGLIRRYS
jgi:hypothetical protein